MILLYDILLARASLATFGRPSSQPQPSPSDLLALCPRCVLAATCNRQCYAMHLLMCMRAGLAGLTGWRDEHADSATPIFGFWGVLIFIFWMALQYVSNIRLDSGPPSARGNGIDGRALDKAPFPFISTRYSARYHLADGISPPHNLERATSFPRVARGSSSRLRHARILNE